MNYEKKKNECRIYNQSIRHSPEKNAIFMHIIIITLNITIMGFVCLLLSLFACYRYSRPFGGAAGIAGKPLISKNENCFGFLHIATTSLYFDLQMRHINNKAESFQVIFDSCLGIYVFQLIIKCIIELFFMFP